MAGNRLKKVAYNRLDREGWVENRDVLDYRQHPPGSTFFDLEALEYSGRNLLKEPVTKEDIAEPMPFVDIGIIDF